MPSTRAMTEQLNVSRTTVINAFDQLTAEGYLKGAVGRGTKVSEQLPEEHSLVKYCRAKDDEHLNDKKRINNKRLISKRGRMVLTALVENIEPILPITST